MQEMYQNFAEGDPNWNVAQASFILFVFIKKLV